MAKKKIIDIEAHSFFRMLERGMNYGLDCYETKERVFETVKLGGLAKRKHLSRRHKTYCGYFIDNCASYSTFGAVI